MKNDGQEFKHKQIITNMRQDTRNDKIISVELMTSLGNSSATSRKIAYDIRTSFKLNTTIAFCQKAVIVLLSLNGEKVIFSSRFTNAFPKTVCLWCACLCVCRGGGKLNRGPRGVLITL